MPRKPTIKLDDILDSIEIDSIPTFQPHLTVQGAPSSIHPSSLLTPKSDESAEGTSPRQSQPKTEHRRMMRRPSSQISKDSDDETSPSGGLFPSLLAMLDTDTKVATDNIVFTASMLSNRATCASALIELRDSLRETHVLSHLRKHCRMHDLLKCLLSKLPAKDVLSKQCHVEILYIIFHDPLNSVFASGQLMPCLVHLLSPGDDSDPISYTSATKPSRLRTESHWLDITPMEPKRVKKHHASLSPVNLEPPPLSTVLTLPRSIDSVEGAVQYTCLRVLIEVLQNCSAQADSQSSYEEGQNGAQRSFLSTGPNTESASRNSLGATRHLSVCAADSGMFTVCGDVAKSTVSGEIRDASLEALELLTVFMGPTPHISSRAHLGGLVRSLCSTLETHRDTKTVTSVCRIVLNISNLNAAKSVLQQRPYLEALIGLACDANHRDDDVAVLVICIFCNVCDGESVGSEAARRVILEGSTEEFETTLVPTLISHVRRHCNKTSRCSTEHSVVAAYSAMLLGVIAIHSGEALEAVKGCLHRACLSMTSLVAVLQEFILFQSEAGVLTRNSLVTFHTIIDRLVEQNNIKISP